MTPLHRKTTYLVALSTVAAALGGFALAGTALGSEWKEYDGRVSAGSAYLISVPAGAEALQLEFVPRLLSTSGAAHATLFDPQDRRVGHYMLDAEESVVALEAPKAGDYVLYVFDVKGGVLTVAVNAEDADDLELVPLLTTSTDHEIAGQSIPGAFRAVDTITLAREPVYEALLYQGSATNLSGTVRSPAGVTSLVDMETGTAHGPGLFTSQSGSRESFPENFAAGVHAIDVTADEFEGTLFLTVVDYVRPEAEVDIGHEHRIADIPANVLMLHESWTATAVEIPEGVMSLDFGLVSLAEDEDEDDDHSHRYRWKEHALLAVFTPDDQLLGFVELDAEDEPTATLPLVGGGEYVIFVYRAPHEDDAMLFASLDAGAGVFGATRHLRTVETAHELGDAMSPVAFSDEYAHQALKAPLAAGIGIEGEPAYAFDLRGVIHTDAGEAHTYEWDASMFRMMPWGRWMQATYIGPELVAGPWAIEVEALSAVGTVTLYTLDYDRDLVDEVVEAEEAEPEEDGGILPPL